MLKSRISCSARSSIRFKFDQLLEIRLTILQYIFLQTAIVLVLCPNSIAPLFKLLLMYMASRRGLWSIANTTTTKVSAQFWNFIKRSLSAICLFLALSTLSAITLFLTVVYEQFESKSAPLMSTLRR